jgi:hypothetical protein
MRGLKTGVMTAALFTVVAPAVASADPLRPPDGTYRYEHAFSVDALDIPAQSIEFRLVDPVG